MADHMTAEQLSNQVSGNSGQLLMTAEQLRAELEYVATLIETDRPLSAGRLRNLAARLSGMAAVPKGWTIVPIEPTDEMDAAAREQCRIMRGVIDPVIHVWDAMLAAAPEPPHV